MTTFRVNKTRDYTVISNHHLKNRELSLKAKGLLSVMLSLPDNWDYSVNGLVSILKEGRDGVTSTLKELEKNGYLKRTQCKNESGKFVGYNYEVYEKPFTENPSTDNLSTENPQQLNTKQLNTKESNTDSNNIYGDSENPKTKTKRFVPPTVDEVSEYCKERNNNIDAEHFVSYYASKGWYVGKTKMKDWRAAVITWERNEKKFANVNQQSQQTSDERTYHMVDDSDILDGLF